MPNKENLRKWAVALRSGEFRQGTKRLYIAADVERGIPESYCCLGVACLIAEREGVKVDIPEASFYADYRWREDATLPATVMEWLGVKQSSVLLGDETATQLNDSDGKSFLQIADIIEEYFQLAEDDDAGQSEV